MASDATSVGDLSVLGKSSVEVECGGVGKGRILDNGGRVTPKF